MRLLFQFIIFLLTLPFSPLFEDYYKVADEDHEEPEHLSWELGVPDNLPVTEVVWGEVDTQEETLDDY
jgi:hypothetical protein